MARSLWKGPFIDFSLWKNIKKAKNKHNKLFSRRSLILPAFIGKKFSIHTGNKWINLTINQDKIGHYFGEFAFTKKIAIYKRKSKLKKK